MKRLFLLLFLLATSPAWSAVTFNGSNQALQIANVDLSGVQAASVSVWYWVNTWPVDTNSILVEFSADINGVTTGFNVNTYDENLLIVDVLGDVGHNVDEYDLAALKLSGAWHHYLFVFDKSQAANEVDLCIDGSLQTGTRSSTNNNTNNFAQDTLNLMARNGASLWVAGRLADVAIWNKKLTCTDAANLTNGTLPTAIEAANLRGYWKLCTDTTPTTDSSGAGHNGTLIGSPTQSDHPAAITASCVTGTPSPIVVNFQ